MTSQLVFPSFPTFAGTDGQPLEDGFIYVGIAGFNAEAAPKTAYWDAALSIVASQPIRTLNGYPSRDGSPAAIYTRGVFSLIVKDKRGRLVYSSLRATSFIGAIEGHISVGISDFGTNDNPGVTDMTAAIKAAIEFLSDANGGELAFDAEKYLITDTINIASNVVMTGQAPHFMNDYIDDGLINRGTWLTCPEGFDRDLVTFNGLMPGLAANAYPRIHAGIYSMGIHGNRSVDAAPTNIDLNSVGSCIVMSGVSYVSLDNVITFRGAEHGVYADSFDYGGDRGILTCNNLSLRDVVSIGNHLDGMRMFGGDSTVIGCIGGYNGRDGINTALGPVIGGRFWNNYRYGALLQGFGVNFSGNAVYSNGQTGVLAGDGNTYSHIIDGNQIYDNGRDGTQVGNRRAGIAISETSGPVVISNNILAVQNGTRRIAAEGTVAGGSGYVNGTYSAVPLSGGTGTLATADITVAGGAVTDVVMISRGTGFTVADVMTCANTYLGGTGSGWSFPVAAISFDFTSIYGATGNQLYGVSATTGTPHVTIVGNIFDPGVEVAYENYNIADTSNATFDHYVFGTRAALVSNWPGLPSGAVARVGNLQWVKDGGASISDMVDASPVAPVSLDHWRTATTATATNAAFTQAIAWFNVGNRQLALPEGQVSISQPVPAITATLGQIVGNSTRLTMTSGSSGNFLTLGDASTTATRVDLTGITLQCNNTPGENDFAVDFRNAAQCNADIIAINAGSVFRAGRGTAAGEKAQQCFVRLRGNFNKGLNCDNAILLENYANLIIDNTITASGGACNTNATGALMRIKPGAAAPCDTLRLQGTMQAFNVSTPGSADGKPYGLVVDLTDNTVTNIFCDACPVFDHTTVMALYVFDGGGSTGTSRDLNFVGLRLATDAGGVVLFDKNSAGTVRWTGWKLNDGHFDVVSNANAVEITGDGWDACACRGNSIVSTSVTVKTRAGLANSDGWNIRDNIIGPNTTSGAAFTTGWEVTNTAIMELVLMDNPCDPSTTQEVVVPTFGTASAPRRKIGWSGSPPIAKASLPTAATSPVGAQFYVIDEAGGAVPAFCDGTNWRRVTDRAIVS